VFRNIRNWLWQIIVDWLNDIPKSNQNMQAINNYDHMLRDLRPADVILFEGKARVSEVIKIITLSPWTHAALYIGRTSEISDPKTLALVNKHYDGNPSEPLVIESLLGFGTVINTLSQYSNDNLRVCRPDGLSFEDQNSVVGFAAEHLGMNYDVRQLLDLARFMFPYAILPRQWRSSLFQHNAGKPTNIVCSSMIARCFQSVNYPMLPIIDSDHHERLKFHKRNFRLFVPTDFDYSPYFKILKFPAWPLSVKESYRELPWQDAEHDQHKEISNKDKDAELSKAKEIKNNEASEEDSNVDQNATKNFLKSLIKKRNKSDQSNKIPT
jgi:hypothetical protein